ncbi:alpha/beta fold hydrolase [Roseivirga pacifica]|uniref:alpha/beta fold hydrolase n=1 Tax=Roseivirga pacifica TaxID=1267423 RepID=UPI00227B9B3D|nr:alpha/beta hydrolase [Roseivirga pacifica]
MPAINFTVKGSGFPVVFIHGFCEDHSVWNHLQETLSKNYKVYCIDLPGFGESPLPNLPFNLADIGEQVFTWAQAQGIDKAAIIGHSLGGYVALEIAKSQPGLVEGLGLINSTAFADDEEGKVKRDKALDFLEKFSMEKFIAPFTPSLFNLKRKEEHKEAIEKATALAMKTTKEAAKAYTLAMRNRPDNFELWKNLNCPTLYIGGLVDHRIPVEKAEAHIEERTGVDGYLMRDVGHMAMLEEPTETIQIIKDFLSKL